jgi:hypothetical protein
MRTAEVGSEKPEVGMQKWEGEIRKAGSGIWNGEVGIEKLEIEMK